MIRNARPSDWDDIMEIYAIARGFMKTAGNPTQWGDIFPPEDMVRNDIEVQQNYVVEVDGRVIEGSIRNKLDEIKEVMNA